MKRKFSSYKEQQMLFENWRKFSSYQPTQLEESINKILSQLDEKIMNEGALEAMGKIANKMGLNKLLLIAALTGAMSSASPAHAGIMDDLSALGNNVRAKIVQVADQAKNQLEDQGMDLGKEIEADQDTKKEKKTLEDFVKEQINEQPGEKVKEIKKVFEQETGNGIGFVYETNIGLIAIAPMDQEMWDFDMGGERTSAEMSAKSLLAEYTTKNKTTDTTTTGDTTTTTTTSQYEGNLPTRNEGIFFTDPGSGVVNWNKGDSYAVVTLMGAP
jgi:hypothetical protein